MSNKQTPKVIYNKTWSKTNSIMISIKRVLVSVCTCQVSQYFLDFRTTLPCSARRCLFRLLSYERLVENRYKTNPALFWGTSSVHMALAMQFVVINRSNLQGLVYWQFQTTVEVYITVQFSKFQLTWYGLRWTDNHEPWIACRVI